MCASPRSDRRQERLLRDFDETARLARGIVVDRYGAQDAERLIRDARERYAAIIPQVSWVAGPRALALNAFLRTTAQEVAVYQAVKAHGGDAAEAWEICHEAIRARTERFPRFKRWLLERFMFSRLVKRIARRRETRGEIVRAGEFEIRFVSGDGTDFDHGVDYLRCGNLELARKLGAEEFAPYVCMSDIALSDAFGWGLTRTQTLADGCSHCDFRFKRDGSTRISSKTPEVQETIERIAKRSSIEKPRGSA
jgi:hypothetical protein